MKMIVQIALANAKYHKSKNILTGVTIFLTTLLLFLVPTIGYGMIECQNVVINEKYPTWHALYRDITEETVTKLSGHHLVERFGLRSDFGVVANIEAEIMMLYLDENGFDLYKQELLEGKFPETEEEIVVSKGVLKELSKTGEIGTTITIPYQVYRNDGLDYIQEKEFVICGFIEDAETNLKQRIYSAFVSQDLLKKEIPAEEISYYFLFQVSAEDVKTTEEMELRIKQLAEQFKISEQAIRVNQEYLGANYVDPAYIPGIVIIMIIIVLAGMITIYSIYYITMGERVQEFGKIKAIGATRKQLRRIVLIEGMIIAGVAIPFGLLVGTFLIKSIYLGMFELYQDENEMMSIAKEFILSGKIQFHQLWIYLLTVFVAVLTVYLSLLRPMKVVARISEIEAIRFHMGQLLKKGKKTRKGYKDITVGKLTKVYLAGNKKKSIITICSMAITGLFFMVVATILSCADPVDGANYSILGEYEISAMIELNNKEHPELEWSEVQKNNPLDEELKNKILQIEGINGIECYQGTMMISDAFYGGREWIIGFPESRKRQLEEGIVEGSVTYEELMMGDKAILNKMMLKWYPELSIGDVLKVVVEEGTGGIEREVEIVAIGDYPMGMTSYSCLIMAEEGIEKFSENNLSRFYHIFADKKYDPMVEEQLRHIVEESGRLWIRVWEEVYKQQKSAVTMTSGMCYTFLGILGVICIMNMINTMIHGVHVRKKEIGMLQAIGMSDAQLYKMLQLEGVFYTAGTLLIAVGGGSLAGYPVFCWAKSIKIFDISHYHYPVEATIVVIVVLVVVQYILTFIIGRSVKKESLIDRIRFSD